LSFVNCTDFHRIALRHHQSKQLSSTFQKRMQLSLFM